MSVVYSLHIAYSKEFLLSITFSYLINLFIVFSGYYKLTEDQHHTTL